MLVGETINIAGRKRGAVDDLKMFMFLGKSWERPFFQLIHIRICTGICKYVRGGPIMGDVFVCLLGGEGGWLGKNCFVK